VCQTVPCLAACCGGAGGSLEDAGQGHAALDYHRSLLRQPEQRLGPAPPDTLTSRKDLDGAYRAAGPARRRPPPLGRFSRPGRRLLPHWPLVGRPGAVAGGRSTAGGHQARAVVVSDSMKREVRVLDVVAATRLSTPTG
jgi:hypothetical protein